MSTALVGVRPLLRTSLKHERKLLAPWVAIVTALSASSVLFYPIVFPSLSDRAGLASAIGANPAMSLIFGPAHDLSTVDGFNAWRSLALGGLLTALGAILTVTRASRGQEDSGQAELLASGVVGRGSRLATAVAMALVMSVAAGVVAALVTVACGGGWAISLLLGATFAATGWLFAGVAAICSQLGTDARTANAIAVATLGILYLLRGFCYAMGAPGWTLWANPLGWIQQTRPAAGDRWWPLLLAVGLTVLLLLVAARLQSRRDFGQGVIAPRPGPVRGRLHSSAALAMYLNRGSLVAWTSAFVALGFVFGYFATSADTLFGPGSPASKILAAGAATPGDLIAAFLTTILTLVGIVASISGVQYVVKMRTEEMSDRVEPVMATTVTRHRYFGSAVLVALGGPTLGVLVAGAVIGALASTADIGLSWADAFGQAAATLPAVWAVVAFAAAVIGARPQVPIAAWVGILLSFGLSILGPTFGLPDWALAVSPFWHVPEVAAGDPQWLGLVWVLLAGAALLAAGFAGFRRRDLAR